MNFIGFISILWQYNTMTAGRDILPNDIELKRKKFKNKKMVKSIKIEFLKRKTNLVEAENHANQWLYRRSKQIQPKTMIGAKLCLTQIHLK